MSIKELVSYRTLQNTFSLIFNRRNSNEAKAEKVCPWPFRISAQCAFGDIV